MICPNCGSVQALPLSDGRTWCPECDDAKWFVTGEPAKLENDLFYTHHSFAVGSSNIGPRKLVIGNCDHIYLTQKGIMFQKIQ